VPTFSGLLEFPADLSVEGAKIGVPD